MFHLIKPNTRINFLGQRYIAFAFSIIMVVMSIGSLAIQGLALDVDFTGGVVLEVGYQQPVELDDVRQTLADEGYSDARVQFFGSTTDIMIRLGPQETEDTQAVSDAILKALQVDNADAEMRRVEFVGSQVSGELVTKGGLALLYTMIGIMIYVMFRFQWKLSVGAVVSLLHDVVIVTGLFSLFQWKFDLTVLAALLAILGYSVNDTIVIFDRQRENYRRLRKADTFEVMNVSINETLSRTILTVLSTMLALLALLFVGGDAVFWFALAMFIGCILGTYSSVYIAIAIALQFKLTREDIYPPKEDEETGHAHP